ncbi:MAG: glycosyltransferase family A protein [Atribacterota bacterium]|nr:glycosyltransferase family A protein [Atribacterota bacterium]
MNNSNEIYVSVIVCIYNGKRTLKQTLNSLVNQDYPKGKYEIILINDGSEDESEKICLNFINENMGKYPIVRYVSQDNRGLSQARNLGIALSKGKIVAYIDQDAVASIKWIKNLVYEFDIDQDLMVIGGKTEILNNQCWFASFIFIINYKTYDDQISIIGTNMAYRKGIFKKVGGFYKAFKHFGDESIFLRENILNKYEMKQVNTAIVFHEWPVKLRQWLRECALNGKYYLWSNKIIQMKNRPKISARDGLRLFSILLFPTFLLTLINPLLFGWILILSSLQLLHRMYTRRKAIYNLLNVYRIKAIYLIPYSIIIIYLGMFIMNINYLIEWFKGERINFDNSVITNLDIKEMNNLVNKI